MGEIDVKKINHVGIAVSNMKKSKEKYLNNGFEILGENYDEYFLTDLCLLQKEDDVLELVYTNNENSKVFNLCSKGEEIFIKSLDMKISFETINENNIVRIEELINKSNQFNLTTRRYTRSELENMKNNYIVYALRVKDKFDDLGIVGVAIVKLCEEIAEIDTFLLSCRVIGRKIEYQFLDYILNVLKNEGYKEVLAKYIKTSKNSLVENFYSDVNFDIMEMNENEKVYKKELI